jgi:hypothetical protein
LTERASPPSQLLEPTAVAPPGLAAPGGPTVFLVVPQGFAARILLRSEVLPSLLSARARVVALVPNPDERYMDREFGSLGVQLEPVRADLAKPATDLGILLYKLRSFTLGHAKRSPAFVRKYGLAAARWQSKRPRQQRAARPALALLWRSRMLRRALVAAESRVNATDIYADLFERHRPDLVVTTSPGNAAFDAAILREAARRRIRTATLVQGWDNPTSKGYGGAMPERVLAWSERMAGQLTEFQDIPRRRIVVTGVPHFDRYADPDGLLRWEELCRQAGLDPGRRLVLFATSSPGAFAHNGLVAETLARAIHDGALGQAQLVVRVHPIFLRPDVGGAPEDLRAVAERSAHVHLDLPRVLSERLRCDLPGDDGPRLAALLRHCAVLVNVYSTTTLEAFLLDRPVALVAPDAALDATAGAGQRAAVREAAGSWDEYAHLRDLVAGGAARVARSMPELVELVHLYMEHPTLDREQRLAAARAECGPVDGRSGERVARELLALCSAPRR